MDETKINNKNILKMAKHKKTATCERQEERLFYIIMSPFIAMFILIKLFPFVWGIIISFTNYNVFNTDRIKFTGLNNYIRVFTDNEAVSAFFRTFGIGLLVVPVSLVICNILALMLSGKVRNIGIFRTIYYIPSIIPAVAAGILWRTIYNSDGGVMNALLNMIGIKSVNWLGYDFILPALLIMMYWGAGGGLLWTLAAIKAVPEELYEAAEIDGANYFQKTVRITIPLISNINYLNLLLGIIGMLQLFIQPVLLAQNGVSSSSGLTVVPLRPTYTYVVHVYQQIFVNLRFGYGLAMIWLVFIVIMALTLIVEKTSKYWVFSE